MIYPCTLKYFLSSNPVRKVTTIHMHYFDGIILRQGEKAIKDLIKKKKDKRLLNPFGKLKLLPCQLMFFPMPFLVIDEANISWFLKNVPKYSFETFRYVRAALYSKLMWVVNRIKLSLIIQRCHLTAIPFFKCVIFICSVHRTHSRHII